MREVQGEEDDVQGSKLKLKQYEQPGELVTLPSGIQYREIETGRGKEASLGSKLSIRYAFHLSVNFRHCSWRVSSPEMRAAKQAFYACKAI